MCNSFHQLCITYYQRVFFISPRREQTYQGWQIQGILIGIWQCTPISTVLVGGYSIHEDTTPGYFILGWQEKLLIEKSTFICVLSFGIRELWARTELSSHYIESSVVGLCNMQDQPIILHRIVIINEIAMKMVTQCTSLGCHYPYHLYYRNISSICHTIL